MYATSYPIIDLPVLTSGTTVAPASAPEINTKPTKKCKVRTGFQAGRVCLRSGPGMDYSPHGTLAEGQAIELLDKLDPLWPHVRAYGANGYIYHLYVEYDD
jgi:hypothetical protein